MEIGERIEELLKVNGIKVPELARKAGCPATTIYTIVNKKNKRIDVGLLVKIAHAFNMTLDEFMGLDVPPPAPKDWRALDREDRETVERIIAAMLTATKYRSLFEAAKVKEA